MERLIRLLYKKTLFKYVICREIDQFLIWRDLIRLCITLRILDWRVKMNNNWKIHNWKLPSKCTRPKTIGKVKCLKRRRVDFIVLLSLYRIHICKWLHISRASDHIHRLSLIPDDLHLKGSKQEIRAQLLQTEKKWIQKLLKQPIQDVQNPQLEEKGKLQF